MTIFEKDADYEAFENVVIEAVARTQTRLLADCVMRNYWPLVVWPREDGELSQFVGWLTLTHTQRWRADRQSTGSGHVYQGCFKSFPLQDDDHLFRVARYAVKASDAVGQIYIGTTRSDCQVAATCAILIGHLLALGVPNGVGSEFLDAKIPAGALDLSKFYLVGDEATDTNTVLPGDLRYMTNHKDYFTKSMDNNVADPLWSGEWCIAVENGLYSGLGLLEISEENLRRALRVNLQQDAGIDLNDRDAESMIKWDSLQRIQISPP